jgi:hypothetical protein
VKSSGEERITKMLYAQMTPLIAIKQIIFKVVPYCQIDFDVFEAKRLSITLYVSSAPYSCDVFDLSHFNYFMYFSTLIFIEGNYLSLSVFFTSDWSQ